MVWGFVIAVAALALLAWAWLSGREARRRRRSLASLAAGWGWTFTPSSTPASSGVFDAVQEFRHGHSRHASNTVEGSLSAWGRSIPWRMGDFEFRLTSPTGRGTTTDRYRLSYAAARLPTLTLPDLLIRPEGALDKLAGAFGFEDINFSSEEFSRMFHVRGRDERFARALITTEVMEYLLTRPSVAVMIEGGWLCVTDGQRLWSVGEFGAMPAWLERFLGLWPESVVPGGKK